MIPFAGCMPYIAPELLPSEDDIDGYDALSPKSDIYAFGILAHEVRSTMPFAWETRLMP
jgi:serine/threonine protein kinase